MNREAQTIRPSWLQAAPEQQGLATYIATLRERIWVVVVAVLVTTGIALLYVVTTDKVYESEAQVLVNPVSADSPLLTSLGLIVESTEPTRAVETAATLMTTNEVAARTIETLGLEGSPDDVLADVKAEPVADSNIVAIVAHAGSPEAARELANGFAEAAIAERTAALQERINARLPALRAEAESTDPVVAEAARDQLATLEGLSESAQHPNLELVAPAQASDSPVAPRPALSLAGGLLAGLVLGIGGAFALQAIDPRLRREEQLRRLFRLPILARVPKERQNRGEPLPPTRLSAPAVEAFRTLRSMLVLRGEESTGSSKVILVTGAAPSEGKTTTAINLAMSLATAGNRVILIDSDLRRPAVSEALGIGDEEGLISVLLEHVRLEEALVEVGGPHSTLRVLPAEYAGGWITELYSLPSTRRMLDEARRLADYVVIDSAPLTAVIDTMPLARYADQVVLVARLGTTHLTSVQRLGELLAENGIEPAGFVVVGTARPPEKGYYHHREASLARRAVGRPEPRPAAESGSGSDFAPETRPEPEAERAAPSPTASSGRRSRSGTRDIG
jgi:capsular exopolysaccharide synthesis family protein